MAFKQTQTLTIGAPLATALLATLTARPAGALLATPQVHLFTNTPSITPQSVVGDFTEANFSGYAAVVMGVLLGPINLTPTRLGVHVQCDWLATAGSPLGQNAFGYWVADTTGLIFYAAELFNAPVPFAVPGDGLSLDLIWPMDEVLAALAA